MTRTQLEHVLRAAAEIAQDDELVVIGSQAILGQFPDAPASLRTSMEVDLYPRHHPERADLVDGTLGELSPFHDTYGYYAQGVGPETAVLPDGWSDRLVPVRNENTRGVTGLCLEVHDLAVAKAVAGREKDRAFLREVARHGLADAGTVRARLQATPLSDDQRARVAARIDAAFRST